MRFICRSCPACRSKNSELNKLEFYGYSLHFQGRIYVKFTHFRKIQCTFFKNYGILKAIILDLCAGTLRQSEMRLNIPVQHSVFRRQFEHRARYSTRKRAGEGAFRCPANQGRTAGILFARFLCTFAETSPLLPYINHLMQIE